MNKPFLTTEKGLRLSSVGDPSVGIQPTYFEITGPMEFQTEEDFILFKAEITESFEIIGFDDIEIRVIEDIEAEEAEFKPEEKPLVLRGEILEFDNHVVEVLVCISEEPYHTQVRRFNRGLFQDVIEKKSRFCLITSYLTAGQHTMTVVPIGETEELIRLFTKPDHFAQFKDSPFVNSKPKTQ